MHSWISAALRLSITSGLLFAVPTMAGEIVVVTGADAIVSVTREQLADIYLGRSTALKPLDLPESNELHDAFYKKATGRDGSQVKAVWSRLIFTGQGRPPKELVDAIAVKRAVAADPKLVGYIDRSDVDVTVKVVLSLH